MAGQKKLFITGGHATPALAVVEEIIKRKLPYEVVWIGRRHAFDKGGYESEEYGMITRRGIRFLPLTTGRLTRVISMSGLVSLVKVPVGLVQAILYCHKEKPDLIVSFGGYIALPVALAGWLLGIPVITHEQTATWGQANVIISRIAKKVCVSNRELLADVPGKGIYTGLPIRSECFTPPKHPSFSLPSEYPILFIVGGSTGSESVNSLIFSSLVTLLDRYVVVHQTGKQGIDHAQKKKDELAPHVRKRYVPFGYFSAEDMSWLLHNCRIVIARSGANTVAEIAVAGAVALFIPLPWAAGDEQMKNAQILAKRGSARIVEQKNLSPDLVVEAVHLVEDQYQELKLKARENKKIYEDNAASRVADAAFSLIP